MNSISSAREVLEVLEVFGGLIAYAAYRFLLLPRMFEHSNNPPVGITNESLPEQSNYRAAGQLVFSITVIICTFFFLNLVGGEVLTVMKAHVLWGAFIMLLLLALLWMIGVMEIIHRKDNKYTDLLSDPDEEIAKLSTRHDQETAALVKRCAILWLVLFAGASLWLWFIASRQAIA